MKIGETVKVGDKSYVIGSVSYMCEYCWQGSHDECKGVCNCTHGQAPKIAPLTVSEKFKRLFRKL